MLFLLRQPIIDLLTNLPEVKSAALVYWPWLLALPGIAAWNFFMDGVFIGATKTKAMQNTMLIATFVVFIPGWYLTRNWHNHGLWFAFCLFHLARSLLMVMMYAYYTRRQQWW